MEPVTESERTNILLVQLVQEVRRTNELLGDLIIAASEALQDSEDIDTRSLDDPPPAWAEDAPIPT